MKWVQTSLTDSLSGICFVVILFSSVFNLEQFNEPGIRQTKPDIRPDKKGRIPGATLFVTLHHDAI